MNNISNNHIISSSSSNSSNNSNSSSNYNTINNTIYKNSILPYKIFDDEKKEDDFTLHYLGIAFCTFIFFLQKI